MKVIRGLIPELIVWSRWRYVVNSDGSVTWGNRLGWGIYPHQYKDSGRNERELTIWLNWFAFRLLWRPA